MIHKIYLVKNQSAEEYINCILFIKEGNTAWVQEMSLKGDLKNL